MVNGSQRNTLTINNNIDEQATANSTPLPKIMSNVSSSFCGSMFIFFIASPFSIQFKKEINKVHLLGENLTPRDLGGQLK